MMLFRRVPIENWALPADSKGLALCYVMLSEVIGYIDFSWVEVKVLLGYKGLKLKSS